MVVEVAIPLKAGPVTTVVLLGPGLSSLSSLVAIPLKAGPVTTVYSNDEVVLHFSRNPLESGSSYDSSATNWSCWWKSDYESRNPLESGSSYDALPDYEKFLNNKKECSRITAESQSP